MKPKYYKLISFAVVALMLCVGAAAIFTVQENDGDILDVDNDKTIGSIPINAIPISKQLDLSYIGSGLTASNGQIFSMSAYYYMTNDIVFTSSYYVPIGTESVPFTGTFNGNGFKIIGFNCNITSYEASAGLFGYIDGATIKNLGVIDSSIRSTSTGGNPTVSTAGGIVAVAKGESTITDCYFKGSVTAHTTVVNGGGTLCASGIIGRCNGEIIISNCYNEGSISIDSNFSCTASGITTGILKSISYCYNSGTITSKSTSANANGICGGISAYDGINNCYNTGSVSATSTYDFSKASGIAASQFLSPIYNCYNTGSITSISLHNNYYSYASGIVANTMDVLVVNCYNTGTISASSNKMIFAGGIIGYSLGANLINCYYLTGTIKENGSVVSDKIAGSTSTFTIDGPSVPPRQSSQSSGAKTSGEMRPGINNAQQGSSIYFTGVTNGDVLGWDFDKEWYINPSINNGFPILRMVTIVVNKNVTIGVGQNVNLAFIVSPSFIPVTITGASWAYISGNSIVGSTLIPGTHTITLSASYMGYTENRTITVTVTNTATINIILTYPGYGRTIHLDASGSVGSITWNLDGYEIKDIFVLDHTFKTSGFKSLSATVEIAGNILSWSDTVFIIDAVPPDTAYFNELYTYTFKVPTSDLINITLYTTPANWLSYKTGTIDSTTSYITVYGIPSQGMVGKIYDVLLTVNGNVTKWKISVKEGEGWPAAGFKATVAGLKVTITSEARNYSTAYYTMYDGAEKNARPPIFTYSYDPSMAGQYVTITQEVVPTLAGLENIIVSKTIQLGYPDEQKDKEIIDATKINPILLALIVFGIMFATLIIAGFLGWRDQVWAILTTIAGIVFAAILAFYIGWLK